MIQIESVTVREFRGIRKLTIKPNRKNFIISGPNGSGKSGVVDAIQFALTGEISRLTGKGTGGLTVSRHGPHVDYRTDPGAAKVSLRLYAPETGKSATLTRSVKSAKSFNLAPDDSKMRAIIDELSRHPELSLSRREIIKYIIVESGQRSKEIQALLKLEELGQTRGVLKTVVNRLSIAQRDAQQGVEHAECALKRHLDVNTLTKEAILEVVNRHRLILGLGALDDVTDDSNLSDGIPEEEPQEVFNRASALRDVNALAQMATDVQTLGKEEAERLVSDLTMLEREPVLFDAILRRSFVASGLELVESPYCPLCDNEWEDQESLLAHLKEKLARADEAEAVQKRLLDGGSKIAIHAKRIVDLISAVKNLAKHHGPNGLFGDLRVWSADLGALASKLGTVEQIRTQRDRLAGEWAAPSTPVAKRLATLRSSVLDTPDQSSSRDALSFLVRAQDRLNTKKCAIRKLDLAECAVEAGRTIYKTYCDAVDNHLSALYAAVEDEFSEFYRMINVDDEKGFRAKLEPAEAGLDLEVTFYNKGMFPPGAYHSEGHQDGMGVCLYLALMKRILGERFRFAVLDDVVMSVDQGHRKEFCRLLQARFPDTQFIITTHDKVWAKQMYTEGLVAPKDGIAFNSWSVQTGPIVEQAADIWNQIEGYVAMGEVGNAASTLRRHMEFVSMELADSLAAKPPYRGDSSYDLGDLLPAVIGRHGELLKDAAKAAKKWKNADAQVSVSNLRNARSKALARCGGEEWVINRAIHWNEWTNFSNSEIRDVVEAFKGLVGELRCTNNDCNSWLYVTPKKGQVDALRCLCGTINVNLRVK